MSLIDCLQTHLRRSYQRQNQHFSILLFLAEEGPRRLDPSISMEDLNPVPVQSESRDLQVSYAKVVDLRVPTVDVIFRESILFPSSTAYQVAP